MPDDNTKKSSDMPHDSAKNKSVGDADAPKREESRSEPRIHVRWHFDAFVDGQLVDHGFVKDISTKGADVFLDFNFQNVKLVKLLIHVPPLHVTDEHHVIEVSGKVIYSNHDSDEMLFRTGIKFLQFTVESDMEYLRSRLAKH